MKARDQRQARRADDGCDLRYKMWNAALAGVEHQGMEWAWTQAGAHALIFIQNDGSHVLG